MELKTGSQLQNGKYILEKKIGEGGFGITYKGIWKMEVPNPLGKTVIEYPVAIKEFFLGDYCSRNDETGEILTKSDAGLELFVRFKEKLKKEAAILLKLDHPNIVNVSEVFEENNTAYMVMEFIDGGNLKDLIYKGELTINDSLRYIKQIAEALEYIHSHNIIHLDVKPANILIDKAGNAKLIDFGIAKQYTDSGQQTQALTVATFSKAYSPVEQYAVNRKEKYGAYTDVYSLGATLYHCLTGEIPVEAASRLSEDLTPPSRLNPDIPTHIEKAILKAMELKHKDRFPVISQFLDALNEESTNPEIGKSKTKTIPLPADFKEIDTEYIIEPQASNKTTTERKRGLIGAAILILVIGIVSFFIFTNKQQILQTDEEMSDSDTVTIVNPVEMQPEEKLVETPPAKTITPAKPVEKPVEQENTSPAVKKTLNIKVNSYYGDVRNGKPDGKGRLTYSAHERISEYDTRETMSEPGDYLDGKWNNGELERGTLFDKEGNKKATIIIGR